MSYATTWLLQLLMVRINRSVPPRTDTRQALQQQWRAWALEHHGHDIVQGISQGSAQSAMLLQHWTMVDLLSIIDSISLPLWVQCIWP